MFCFALLAGFIGSRFSIDDLLLLLVDFLKAKCPTLTMPFLFNKCFRRRYFSGLHFDWGFKLQGFAARAASQPRRLGNGPLAIAALGAALPFTMQRRRFLLDFVLDSAELGLSCPPTNSLAWYLAGMST